MPEKPDLPEWKTIGWIGLFILSLAIGFGSLYFGKAPSGRTHPATQHAAK